MLILNDKVRLHLSFFSPIIASHLSILILILNSLQAHCPYLSNCHDRVQQHTAYLNPFFPLHRWKWPVFERFSRPLSVLYGLQSKTAPLPITTAKLNRIFWTLSSPTCVPKPLTIGGVIVGVGLKMFVTMGKPSLAVGAPVDAWVRFCCCP